MSKTSPIEMQVLAVFQRIPTQVLSAPTVAARALNRSRDQLSDDEIAQYELAIEALVRRGALADLGHRVQLGAEI